MSYVSEVNKIAKEILKVMGEGIVTDKGCSCPVCGTFTLFKDFIADDDGGMCVSCQIAL